MTESNDHQIKHPVTEGVSGSKSNVGQISQTDKEPITADDGLLRKTRALVRCWIEDWGYDMPITDVDAKVEGVIQEAITQHTTTLQAQLEQSEARLALVVDAIYKAPEVLERYLDTYGPDVVAMVNGLAMAAHATTEQVSSYRESLIQQGREQGVRESIEAVKNHPYGYLMDSELFKALQSLQNQGGV